MKVFYHIDNDGKCAGFWVRALAAHTDNYPLEFYRINYDVEFPLDIIQDDEQVYIVDYSIFPEQMDKLLEITENVTWIDHHKSAIERYADYDKEIRGLRYDGIAGCMLTYCYLTHMTDGGEGDIRPFAESMTEDAPMFTKFIADYDVWKFEYGATTRAFTFGFELYDNEPVDSIWNKFIGDIDDELLEEIVEQGNVIIAYRSKFAAEYCEEKGFEGELDGHSFFALNLAKIDSHDFDSIDASKYDMLIGFSFNGKEWAYSLRSTTIDCSEVAMKYGGGGHKGASGFSTKELILHQKD